MYLKAADDAEEMLTIIVWVHEEPEGNGVFRRVLVSAGKENQAWVTLPASSYLQ